MPWCRTYMNCGRSTTTHALEEVTNKGIAKLLSAIAINAFTMTNTELKPLGVGLFPLAAMLNHSCRCAFTSCPVPPCLRSKGDPDIITTPAATASRCSRLHVSCACLNIAKQIRLLGSKSKCPRSSLLRNHVRDIALKQMHRPQDTLRVTTHNADVVQA
jgi:hypothetical protein